MTTACKGSGAAMTRQDNPDGEVRVQVDAETVHQSVNDLRKSLTLILAYAQMLQRRSRQGVSSTPAQVDRSADVICRATADMIHELKKLEDACDG